MTAPEPTPTVEHIDAVAFVIEYRLMTDSVGYCRCSSERVGLTL